MRRALTLMALIVAGEAIFSLPFVLPRIFRPTVLDVFAVDNTQLGTAMSVYGVVAMVAYVFGGPLADRFSTRRMMALALVATAAGGGFLWTIPGFAGLIGVYAFWGVTTILLFWAGLMRATRAWGGSKTQGRAFGLLDGGRGLVSANLATFGTVLFAWWVGDAASDADHESALRNVIAAFTALTALAGAGVWFLLPDAEAKEERIPALTFSKVRSIVRLPGVWFQGVIIVCAYVAYKGTDDLSLMTRDALGATDVEAAWVGSLAFWIRPIAAAGAGLVADRVGGAKTVGACFVLLIVSDLGVATGVMGPLPVLLFTSIVGTCLAVYALRGVYFALFPEAGVPLALTGTAVGIVSLVGYTPDVFFGPLMGFILDATPGAEGHRHLFLVLALFAAGGALATWFFVRFTHGRGESTSAPE